MGTSVEDSVHSAQMYSNFNQILTIPHALLSSSDLPVLLLDQLFLMSTLYIYDNLCFSILFPFFLCLFFPFEIKESDPGSPPVIIQMNLERRAGRLRRPVPVHMSSLAEKGGEEENDEMEVVEVNQNYKQYAKATPVARTVEDEQSDEQEKGSFSSCTSTPRGKGSTDLLRTSLVSMERGEGGGWVLLLERQCWLY